MKTVRQLDDNTRYWFDEALRWADGRWSNENNLLQMPLDRQHLGTIEGICLVRDLVWYALGLMMRQNPGDIARAQTIIKTLMRYQYDEPSAVYHGTFARYNGEPHPPENAVIWRDYDPNWREFICTVFIVLLRGIWRTAPRRPARSDALCYPPGCRGSV